MIKVVAFDLDDTLWSVAPVIHRAEAELADWLRARVPNLVYTAESMRGIREEILKHEASIIHRITELRRRSVEAALLHSGLVPTDAHRLSCDAIEVFLCARNNIELFDGARDALTQLAKQFTLGALSNGNADIYRLGLNDVFSFSFSAEQVGAPKPAYNLFQAALSHTGVAPEEMIYVGDDPKLDVDPANRLGLRTILVSSPGGKPPGETTPHETIVSVRHVVGAVARINGGA